MTKIETVKDDVEKLGLEDHLAPDTRAWSQKIYMDDHEI